MELTYAEYLINQNKISQFPQIIEFFSVGKMPLYYEESHPLIPSYLLHLIDQIKSLISRVQSAKDQQGENFSTPKMTSDVNIGKNINFISSKSMLSKNTLLKSWASFQNVESGQFEKQPLSISISLICTVLTRSLILLWTNL